jgi:multiple sugar transport system ATP-binding protein
MAGITFTNVTKRFADGTLAIDGLSLHVHDGEFLILVGPSGCGKTTALRMVAGLEEVTAGEIRIGDRVVNDLEPLERDVAMVFQNYALYPHMTAWDNIAFPLQMQRAAKPEVARRVREAARLLGLEDLLQRRPRELSGGQRQRVAMGRAIIREPQAFLMDEPLSNLDAKLRIQMRAELARLHRRLAVTTLYVTHDQTEAMTLGHRVCVLRDGVAQQVDTPQGLYRRPANTFVASFIGSPPMNFFRARLENGAVDLGAFRIELEEDIRTRLLATSGEVIVGLRPDAFEDASIRQTGTTIFPTEVEVVEELGPQTVAYVRCEGLEVVEFGERPFELAGAVTVALDPETKASAGGRLDVAVKGDALRLFEPSTGSTLVGAPTPAKSELSSPVAGRPES